MKNFIFILMLCFGCSTYALAQQPDSLPAPAGEGAQPLAVSSDGSPTEISDLAWAENLASQSVESNMLIRRVNTPTDKYTGVVNVEIPLYEINTGSGTLPISLHYLTTGIRVDDISSSVGLGWELSAGGKITRVVRGEPDNFEQLKITSDLSSWNQKQFELYTRDRWDTEPDIYFFELPKTNGCFVFDGNGNAHTIPDVHFDITYDKKDNTFQIYDTEGTCYIFTNMDMNEWFLTEMVYPDNTKITFSYRNDIDHNRPYTIKIPNYISQIHYYPDHEKNKVTYYKAANKDVSAYRKLYSARLASIKCGPQVITFDYYFNTSGSYRDSTYYFIKAMNVRWNERIYHKYHFEYDMSSYTKYKLLSVYEQLDDNKEIRPICKLDYYDGLQPSPDYMGIDHWGFCNSQATEPEVCPAIEIGSFTTNTFGASRKPNLALTRAQSLRKITYPNGGSKEFVYELHRGINPRTGREEDAGGLRIRQIIERTSDKAVPSIRKYEYNGGEWYRDVDNYITKTDSSIYLGSSVNTVYRYYLSSRPVSSVSDFFGVSVVYSDIKEYLPNGSYKSYHYTPLDSYRDPRPDKYLITTYGPQFKGKETDGRTQNSTRTWRRRLLLWQKVYDATGKLVGQEEFRYRIDTAQAVRIPGHRMYADLYSRSYENSSYAPAIERRYYVGKYEWVSCNVLLKDHIIYGSDTRLPQRSSYLHSKNGLLKSLYHKDAEGNITTQTFKYPEEYRSRMIMPDTNLRALEKINLRTPLETVTYRNGKILNASLNTYKVVGVDSLLNKALIVPDCYYSLRSTLQDSVSFTPSRLDINGQLIFDKVAYKLTKSCLEYDANRLCCYMDENGRYNSIVYSPVNPIFPTATISNAYYTKNGANLRNEVIFDDFDDEGPYTYTYPTAKSGFNYAYKLTRYLIPSNFKPGEYIITYWYNTQDDPTWRRERHELTIKPENIGHYIDIPGAQGKLSIDDLAIIPRNATLESSERIGPLGILSETDARGHSLHYRYNSVGLPIEISDEQGNILKKYTYDPKFIQL